MRGRPALVPPVNRNEFGVRARRARHPQNLPKETFKKKTFKT
jgi:hypothetical protein